MEELPYTVINGAKNKYKFIFFGILILSIGVLSGVALDRYVLKNQIKIPTISQPSPQKIDESKLPISLSLLTNPIVYEWRGSVEGRLIDKKEHFFTLTNDSGKSITITDIAPTGDIFKTVYYEKTKLKWKEISLNDIPIGSNLLGDFFIFKGGKNTPVGSSFKVEK